MAHPTWPDVIARLIAKQNLTAEETAWAINDVMDGNASGVVLAGFLTALAGKGETPAEIRGMSEAMLAHAVPLSVEGEQLDIVGTGGDRLKTVNVSTTAALVVAAAGVPVVKHGNRASSSASGAADCLEALGVAVDLPAEEVERVFAELGIAFVFANAFHPAMRFVSPTRRELGVATAFNILGPLTNPARPAVSAIGVSREDFAALVCGVLADRGSRGLVFRCRNGMDELSAAAPNDVWEVREGGVVHREFDAVDELGLPPATVDDLRGGEPDFNAEVTGLKETGDIYKQYGTTDARGNAVDYSPNVMVNFWSFRLMIGLGMTSMGLGALALWLTRANRLVSRPLLGKAALATMWMPFIACSFGWIFREMGRQPWVIVPNLSDPVSQVYMLTADGVSSEVSSGTVLASMVIFTLLYAALGVVWFMLLRRYIREGVRTPMPDKTGTSKQTDQDSKDTDSDNDSDGDSVDSSEAAPALSFAY